LCIYYKIKIIPSTPSIVEHASVKKEDADVNQGESMEKKTSKNKDFKKGAPEAALYTKKIRGVISVCRRMF